MPQTFIRKIPKGGDGIEFPRKPLVKKTVTRKLVELTSERSWEALLHSSGISLGVSFPGFPDLQPREGGADKRKYPEPGGENFPPPGSLPYSLRTEMTVMSDSKGEMFQDHKRGFGTER